MADMSGRAGDSLAEKAQLGGETQKGHSTAQTRDRECVKRLDLLNPELQSFRCLGGDFSVLPNQNFRGWALKSLTSVGLNKGPVGLGRLERCLKWLQARDRKRMRCPFGSLLRKLILGRGGK